MKKITDLKKRIYTTKEVTNKLGQRERIRVPIEMTRKVNTIQGATRFGHYIIDFFIIAGVLTALALIPAFRSLFEPMFSFTVGNFRYDVNLIGYISVFAYYMTLEATIGRTLGKFATRAYVIDEYGKQPNATQIFIRTISRFIPFYALSCLGERGWHDQISKTYVVSKTEWEALKKKLAEEDGFTDDLDILDA